MKHEKVPTWKKDEINRSILAGQAIMLLDHDRLKFYDRALADVCAKKVVLEIGSGTGILAALAAKHGAKHVYTVERTAVMSELARSLIKRLGLQKVVTVIHADSKKIPTSRIPKADVLVQEIFGADPLAEGVFQTLHDSKRFLKKDAVLIPEALNYCFTPVFREKSNFLHSLSRLGWNGIEINELASFVDDLRFPYLEDTETYPGTPSFKSETLNFCTHLMASRSFRLKVVPESKQKSRLKSASHLLVTFELLAGKHRLLSWSQTERSEKLHWAPFLVPNPLRNKSQFIVSGYRDRNRSFFAD